jgi:hypothetical protein
MGGVCRTLTDLFGPYTTTSKTVTTLVAAYEKCCLDLNGEVAKKPPELDTDNNLSIEAQCATLMYKCIRETMNSVAFVMTQHGLIGLAPLGTQQGDFIAIISRLAYPFVVRVIEGTEFFVLLRVLVINMVLWTGFNIRRRLARSL